MKTKNIEEKLFRRTKMHKLEESGYKEKGHIPYVHLFLIGFVIFLLFAGVNVVSAAAPSITDWSSSGGTTQNKDNNQDIMYLVQQGDVITFNVTATGTEPIAYEWQVNKVVDVSATTNTFIWTVPNEKSIWEIHLKASNAEGEDHIEWVVSTLNASEAPDIFDYFTDKKTQGRTETNPWGRSLPNWSISMNTAKGFVESPTEGTIPSSISYGTWKFRYYPKTAVSQYNDLRFRPYETSGASFQWEEECHGSHHHCMLRYSEPDIDYSVEYDCGGPYGETEEVHHWWEITIIRTSDNFTYAFYKRIDDDKGEMLDLLFYESKNFDWDKIRLQLYEELSGDEMYFDGLEVYENKYFFPEKEIKYGQFITKEVPSGYYLYPQYDNGIIIKGRNENGEGITLSDINEAIGEPSLFTYNSGTKTAICYTNLYISEGAEFIIKDETLKFHCDSDGQWKFAIGHGASLIIEKSTITTDTGHYFVWDFASPTTHLGRQLAMYYVWPELQGEDGPMRYKPQTLGWSYYGRFIVKDSVINNSAHLYLDSPYELNITNTEITNLHEVDIGDYSPCSHSATQTVRSDVKGNKSLFIQTDDLNVKDFKLNNITLSGTDLNITFATNAHRDKLNIYDIDMQNANVVIKNSLAQTEGRSHTCYVGGSSGPWGKVYTWKSYIASEIGLVNCKFKDVVITPDVFTDAEGRSVEKSALVKHYLDVKVVNSSGNPVPGANVGITCEQSWTDDERKTNHYPVENMEITTPYATGNYKCVYHLYRFIDGQPLSSTLTSADGHTPLPSDKLNSFVITDYKKYLDTGTAEVKQENFTYAITASKDGKTASMSGLGIDETWYREDANTPTKTIVCNLDTGLCSIEGGVPDTTAPTASNGQPTGIVSDNTPTLSVASDEPATCKGSIDLDETYDNMDFSFTGTGTSHTYNIATPLSDDSHTVYVRCKDTVGNIATSSYSWSFTVDTSTLPDTTPPAAVTVLSTSNPTSTAITLTWISPGDDGDTGTATEYDIRYRENEAITDINWDDVATTQCTGEPTPQIASNTETFTVPNLSPETTYYFALKTADEVPNWSGISNSPSGTTIAAGDSIFSDVFVEAITNASAKVYWETDIPGTSYVEYGLDMDYGYTSPIDELTRVGHSATLTGLVSNTIYHYRVLTKDIYNELHVSNDYTFTTLESFTPLGKDYYVSTSGSDSSNGLTLGTAWRTIIHAASQVSAGDTVWIEDGTYNEAGKVNIYANGTDINPITFKAYNGSPLISGSGIWIWGSYINIQDLRITSSDRGINVEQTGGEAGGPPTDHINIINCEVYNTGSVGFYGQSCSYVTIDNCHFHHNSWNSIMFGVLGDIGYESHHNSITNCKVDHPSHSAIDITVHNNNIYTHHHMDILNNDVESKSAFHHWDILPEFRVFNYGFNKMHNANHAMQISGLTDSFVHNSNFYGNSEYDIKGNYLKGVTFYNNTADHSTYQCIHLRFSNDLLFIENMFPFLGTNEGVVIVRNHKETPYYAYTAAADGGYLIVEYTDGRTFSIDGSGEYTTYTFISAGGHTIAVSGQPSVGAISGRVTDAKTGLGIVNATVSVEGTTLEGKTNSNGDYQIENVPVGDEYTVTASVDTYDSQSITGVHVLEGQTTEGVDFILTKETTPPTITAHLPKGEDVPVDTTISVTFSEEMNTTAAEKALSISPAVTAGSFSWDGNEMTFTPTSDLSNGTTYTVTIDTDAQDLAGNSLDGDGDGAAEGSPTDDYEWTFTTKEQDLTPPAAVTNLSTSNFASSSITLTWTSSGDDGDTGTASEYDIRYSTSQITETSWSSTTQVTNEPTPQEAGNTEIFTVTGLSPETTYYFALKTADEVSNWSTISNSPSGTTLEENHLVAEWHFDEGNGDIAGDSSGNGNNGILSDSLTMWTHEGKINSSLQFEGADDYVKVPDSSSLDSITNNITLIAWVKTYSFDDHQNIIEKWDFEGVNQRSFELKIKTDGTVQWGISPDGTSSVWLTSNGAVSGNTWTHIAVTSDGETMKIFINSEEDPNKVSAPSSGIYQSTADLHIGRWWGGESWIWHFNGTIDEVKIYNRALSVEEIKADYEAGSEDTTGSISGTITYTRNETGIAGVTVNLTQNGTSINSTVTDGDGNYTFADVPPGEYNLTASKIRFWSNSTTSVTVNAGASTIINLALWLKGDLNGDGTPAGIGDVAIMESAWAGEIPKDYRYDLNNDGHSAGIGDVAIMKSAWAGEIILE